MLRTEAVLARSQLFLDMSFVQSPHFTNTASPVKNYFALHSSWVRLHSQSKLRSMDGEKHSLVQQICAINTFFLYESLERLQRDDWTFITASSYLSLPQHLKPLRANEYCRIVAGYESRENVMVVAHSLRTIDLLSCKSSWGTVSLQSSVVSHRSFETYYVIQGLVFLYFVETFAYNL